ncbi:MAG: bifunctional 3'-5' exonuclease/DNA polymerase, partial [Pseudolysinimonas sp.]
MLITLRSTSTGVVATDLDDDGAVGVVTTLDPVELASWVASREAERPRWVWNDTSRWYPPLLAVGVRVERCIDLRLCHAILRNSATSATPVLAGAASDDWDRPARAARAASDALFDLDPVPDDDDPVAEYLRQREAVAGVPRLGLLLAAESVGALVAVEMRFAGLPWDVGVHDELLTDILGPRVAGGRPEKLE